MEDETIGKHLVVEFYGCDAEAINNMDIVEEAMFIAANKSGATILRRAFHKFEPYGITGVLVLAESHCTCHTYPEIQYVAADLFTCGSHTNPLEGIKHLEIAFKAKHYHTRDLDRGNKTLANLYMGVKD